MKNILMLFLTIGLLVSAVSCSDKGDNIDYIILKEVRYINETGFSPIKLDFYRKNAIAVSLSFCNTDTSVVASENNSFRWVLPGSCDSVVVNFSNDLSKSYNGNGRYVKGVQNPCLWQCYEHVVISNSAERYTFTFTKDMLE